MPMVLPCREAWCPNYQPCPVHPIRAFAGSGPMPADWPTVRAGILRRDPQCRSCGLHPSETVDHIVPRAIGGTDAPSNLQGLCLPCHRHKTAIAGGYAAH